MPIQIPDIYNDFTTWVNTSQNGFFRPETDFKRALQNASISLWNELTDEAENNQSVTDDLRPFLRTRNMIVNNDNLSFGRFNEPPEYGRYSAARLILYNGKTVGYEDCDICNSKPNVDEQETFEMVERYLNNIIEVDVKKVDSSKWAAALQNKTKAPTLNKPIITQSKSDANISGFKVAPRQTSVVVLDYYVEPKPVNFVYTTTPINTITGAGGEIIFGNSTPLEWPITVKNRLLEIIKNIYIGFTRDGLLQQIDSAQKPLK